jgi:formylglycine-generating enzyme required for sulfatase activity
VTAFEYTFAFDTGADRAFAPEGRRNSKRAADGDGMRMKAGHLKLTGYRLPTEAEWEFACRGGAVTAWYHGRGEELLPRYGWFLKTADDRAWPVGGLRPNELGLFDALGNVQEWTEGPGLLYAADQTEDTENSRLLTVDERMPRVLRGSSFNLRATDVRCALRNTNRPGYRNLSDGFRPTRTLPDR